MFAIPSRFKKLSLPLPQDLPGANDYVRQVGEHDRAIQARLERLSKAIQRLEEDCTKELEPVIAERDELRLAIEGFATINREALTKDGKTVTVPAGSFGWYMPKKKVIIGRGRGGNVLAWLKEMGLKKYVRVKEAINKEALLCDQPAIPDVRYVQKEKFVVKPNEVTEPASDGKLRLVA